MTGKLQTFVYGVVLIPVTLVAGLVAAIIGDRIRVWRNAKRWTR